MKTILCGLALMIGFALSPSIAASDLILSRTVINDGSGALTIADVARREVTPLAPTTVINRHDNDTVYWVRLRVQAPAHGHQVVLFVRPNYINDLRLYEAAAGDPLSWKPRVTGNYYPFSQRDRASIGLGFVVDVNAPETTYYLRVKTRSPASMYVEALEPAEADRKDQQRNLLMVFFVTAMVFLVFWAILSYFVDKQAVVGLFALHQATYTLFGIVATGYLAPWCPASFPQLSDWAIAFFYFTINFTSLLFCRELFKPYQPPRGMMRVLNLLLWVYPPLLVTFALGHTSVAIVANAALIKLTWIFLVVMSFTLRVEGTPKRVLLRIFFVAVLLNNGVFWITQRGSGAAFQGNLGAVQLLVVDGLIIGGLFALMVHTRTRQVLREGQQAAMDLLLVQKAFEIEQELKRKIEIQAQTDDLTGLHNRGHFLELAEHERSRAIRFQRPFTLLEIDIDHFKAINDTWGHSAGDEVLQRVSSLLRETLRAADLLGRTGGEEFSAVIVETEGANAIEIAQRLCTSVRAAEIHLHGGKRIEVSISIGLAQLEGRQIELQELLQEADRAMYSAKRAGRNQVVVRADPGSPPRKG